MDDDRRLAAVSAAQLLTQLAGLRIAVRRRLPPDLVLVDLPSPASGVAAGSIVLGTARSAPGLMLCAQAAATASLAAGPNRRARRVLGVLGAAMTVGHLIERNSPLWPGHGDRVGTPLYALGLAGSAAMAALGVRLPERTPDVVVRQVAAASVDRVWELATDLEGSPRILTGVDRVEVLTPGPFRVGTRWRETRTIAGRSATEEMRVTELEPRRSYTVEADSAGVHYRSTFVFSPTADGGTEITLRFGGEARSRLARVAAAVTAPLARRSVARALRGDLGDLAHAATGR